MAPSATHMSPVQPFLDSGRSMVTVTTCPSRSTTTLGCGDASVTDVITQICRALT